MQEGIDDAAKVALGLSNPLSLLLLLLLMLKLELLVLLLLIRHLLRSSYKIDQHFRNAYRQVQEDGYFVIKNAWQRESKVQYSKRVQQLQPDVVRLRTAVLSRSGKAIL